MIDFCLKPVDNALSGPSRSKILNELTNDIFKALMIGEKSFINDVMQEIQQYISRIKVSECPQDEFPIQLQFEICEKNQKEDLENALVYISWLESLVINGTTFDTVLGGIYDRGYKGLLTALKDGGCVFPGGGVRPYPVDKNICLSILDLGRPHQASKTRDLNSMSNCASRAILYGSKLEKNKLASWIDNSIREFAIKWTDGNLECQEVRYLRSLSLLLRVGISKAEEMVTAMTYESDAVPVRVGSSALTTLSATSSSDSLRLYDNYLNAFHRVVESCLSEISTRLNGGINAQNDDFLLNFVQWEQSLRRNLTADYWKQNPSELVGTWEFVDIKSAGGLRNLMINSKEYIDSDGDDSFPLEDKYVVSLSDICRSHEVTLVHVSS